MSADVVSKMRRAGFFLDVERGKLIVESSEPVTEEQREYFRKHKLELIMTLELERHGLGLGEQIPWGYRWRFIDQSPFTRTMIERSRELWDGPISAHDVGLVEDGFYLFTNREQYLSDFLYRWARENPERMAQLRQNIRNH